MAGGVLSFPANSSRDAATAAPNPPQVDVLWKPRLKCVGWTESPMRDHRFVARGHRGEKFAAGPFAACRKRGRKDD